MEFFATCATGFEATLADELRRAKVRGLRPLTSGVSFNCDLIGAYRALLWSRTASRVLLTLTRVAAQDADELYEGTLAVPWEDHLDPNCTIAVSAYGVNEALHDTRFTALRVKDAICDRLRDRCGARPSVDSKDPDLRINVSLHRLKATISIDLSGMALDRRGYRPEGLLGPTLPRENLAAATLLWAGWPERCAQGAGLCNPLCGNATLAIEAACMAHDIAPGILRSKWGFQGWLGHEVDTWNYLIDEADERAEAGQKVNVPIIASDADSGLVEQARSCARRAGVGGAIDFGVVDGLALPESLVGAHSDATEGILICALPHGEQALSPVRLPAFYASLAARIREDSGLSGLVLLAPDSTADGALASKPIQDMAVQNGPFESGIRIYDLSNPETGSEAAHVNVFDRVLNVNDSAAEQFAARLTKVAKQRAKWARRSGVSAYRVYDADLPDYNLAVDIYNGAGRDEGRRWIHVAEYAAPRQIDPAKTARRLSDALTIIPAVFDVALDDIFVKQRVRAKGGSQYAASGSGEAKPPIPRRQITMENDLLIGVDFADRLDTGLFLDHRETRALLRSMSEGKDFLNLFAYTGTATLYAAAGGANSTTTVDLSNTYLSWAQDNLRLNGLAGRQHSFVRADVLSWVSDKRHSSDRWDLVFVDPPTFSNSSKMGRRDWDVQRDHVELLIDVSRLLTHDGIAVFSCNLRNFEPDLITLNKAGVVLEDITEKTIPTDFERNTKVHHCYLLKRQVPVLN